MSEEALTVEQVFAVRELHVWGLSSSRIAELLEVPEPAVSRATRAEAAEPDLSTVVEVADDVEEGVPVASPLSWLPPAGDATVWQEFMPRGARAPVRARQVPLSGVLLWVSDDGLVWCGGCRRFVPPAELPRADLGHRAGAPFQGGIVVAHEDEGDGPLPVLRSRFRDLMREPW